MKKTLKIFTAFAVLCATMSQFTAISAATEDQESLEAKTTIKAIIKKAGLAGGNEDDDDKVVEDIDKDSDQNAGENTGNGDGNGSFGNAQLAIWRKPGTMKFQGKYSAFTDYALHFQPKPGHEVLRKTEEEFKNLSQAEKDKATEIGKKSMISIADVRSNSKRWNLKVKLSQLDLEGTAGTTSLSPEKYGLEAKMKAYKHLQEPGKVHVYQFAKDGENHVDPRIRIDENTYLSPKTARDVKIGGIGIANGETEKIAYAADDSNAKGYTALVLEDMKLVVEAGEGEASNNRGYEGQIIWTLSSDQPVTDQPVTDQSVTD